VPARHGPRSSLASPPDQAGTSTPPRPRRSSVPSRSAAATQPATLRAAGHDITARSQRLPHQAELALPAVPRIRERVSAHLDVPLAQHVTAERRLPDACNPTSTATTGTSRTLAWKARHQATRLQPQINPFGMPPLMAADMLDADPIGGARTDTLANLVTFSDSRRPSRIVAGKNNEADEDPPAREDPVVTVPCGGTGG
jgi:hypothetical protein